HVSDTEALFAASLGHSRVKVRRSGRTLHTSQKSPVGVPAAGALQRGRGRGDFSQVTEPTPAHQVRRGDVEGYEAWTLDAPGAELSATFAPGAGMVGCS